MHLVFPLTTFSIWRTRVHSLLNGILGLESCSLFLTLMAKDGIMLLDARITSITWEK